MDGGGAFGAIGSIAGSAIQASATKKATKMQVDALKEARDFVFTQLEPGKVNARATEADVQRAQQRLKLQGKIDPALLATRYAGEQKLLEQTQQLGNAPSDQLAALAAGEATANSGAYDAIKQRLIDTAIQEIDAGATLPPDVQNELVRAGLERAGSVSGAATGKGFGGNIVRKMVGERALKLRQDRQTQAAALATSAQNLDTARANILGQLFPNLQRQQLQNMEASAKALGTAEALKPEAGLSGGDIANLWAARVGAANNLNIRAAEAGAAGTQALGGIWGKAVGSATAAGAPMINNLFAPKTDSSGRTLDQATASYYNLS
jgi:hypothetical protein